MDLFRDAEQLRQVPMFARLDAARLKLLAFTSEESQFRDGEVLFRAGAATDSAYVVMSGEVEVFADEPVGEPLVVLGENQLIGEMGVIGNSPRSATLKARGEVRSLRIASDDFLHLMTENPEIALDVMRQLVERLANTTRMLEEARSVSQNSNSTAGG